MDMYGYVRICMDMYVHADVAALDALVDPMPCPEGPSSKLSTASTTWVGSGAPEMINCRVVLPSSVGFPKRRACHLLSRTSIPRWLKSFYQL